MRPEFLLLRKHSFHNIDAVTALHNEVGLLRDLEGRSSGLSEQEAQNPGNSCFETTSASETLDHSARHHLLANTRAARPKASSSENVLVEAFKWHLPRARMAGWLMRWCKKVFLCSFRADRASCCSAHSGERTRFAHEFPQFLWWPKGVCSISECCRFHFTGGLICQ